MFLSYCWHARLLCVGIAASNVLELCRSVPISALLMFLLLPWFNVLFHWVFRHYYMWYCHPVMTSTVIRLPVVLRVSHTCPVLTLKGVKLLCGNAIGWSLSSTIVTRSVVSRSVATRSVVTLSVVSIRRHSIYRHSIRRRSIYRHAIGHHSIRRHLIRRHSIRFSSWLMTLLWAGFIAEIDVCVTSGAINEGVICAWRADYVEQAEVLLSLAHPQRVTCSTSN